MKISEYIQKMGKEFITFGNIEIEKQISLSQKANFDIWRKY